MSQGRRNNPPFKIDLEGKARVDLATIKSVKAFSNVLCTQNQT